MTILLLRVMVQPIYVEMNDGVLGKELTAPPVSVTAQDWPEYPTKLAEANLNLPEEVDTADEKKKPRKPSSSNE